VETRNLREPRAYDVTGLPFAGDGKTVIKERFYLEKGDPNVLWDDITVVDSSLTRAYFKHQKTIRTNQAWTSETCAADNNWVKIGDENYFVNTADGRLMPSKKGQRPPGLEPRDAGRSRPQTGRPQFSGGRRHARPLPMKPLTE
jgi:hypothetical protein